MARGKQNLPLRRSPLCVGTGRARPQRALLHARAVVRRGDTATVSPASELLSVRRIESATLDGRHDQPGKEMGVEFEARDD